MNNHYAKAEYKGIKTAGVTDYKNQTPPYAFRMEKNLSITPVKNVKILIKCVNLQCVNNHYAKAEYKGIKTAGVTNYKNQTPPYAFRMEKNLSITPVKNVKILIKCVNLQCVNNHNAKAEYKGMKTI